MTGVGNFVPPSGVEYQPGALEEESMKKVAVVTLRNKKQMKVTYCSTVKGEVTLVELLL